jgi:hypothetical protein
LKAVVNIQYNGNKDAKAKVKSSRYTRNLRTTTASLLGIGNTISGLRCSIANRR